MCAKCVNDNIKLVDEATHDNDKHSELLQWGLRGYECNWENPHLICDNCDERIPSAYADDNELSIPMGLSRLIFEESSDVQTDVDRDGTTSI
jgi:hypothetical protein